MNEENQATPKAENVPATAAPAPAQATVPPATEAPNKTAPKGPKKAAPKAKPRNAPATAASAAPETEKPASANKSTATPVKKVATAEAPASSPAPAEPPKPAKAKKHAPAKPKLVRDSFTLPEDDYARFASLKQRALKGGVEVKKSELLRAGLAMLARADDAEFLKAVGLVERIKTGRPKK